MSILRIGIYFVDAWADRIKKIRLEKNVSTNDIIKLGTIALEKGLLGKEDLN